MRHMSFGFELHSRCKPECFLHLVFIAHKAQYLVDHVEKLLVYVDTVCCTK